MRFRDDHLFAEVSHSFIRQQKPILVIVDLIMPQMTGWEFVRKMRNDPATREIPVMVITGFHVDERVQKSLRIPPSHIIQKPFSFLTLQESIGEAVKQARAKPDNMGEA